MVFAQDDRLGPAAAPSRKREVLFLILLALLAATARLVFLADWAATPLFHTPTGDELNFHQTALDLMGGGAGTEAFLYQPLYSFFLALVYTLLGVDVGLVRTVQLGLGVITCLLVYGLGREIGGRFVGRIAALLAALYGPQIFFEGCLLDPALTVPLLTGALWALAAAARRKLLWPLLPAGIGVGLALMARPNLALVLPVVFFWLLFSSGPARRKVLALGLGALGLIVGLSPSWIHNLRRGQSLVMVSASGGHSFYIGNNPEATGRFHVPPKDGIDATSHQAYRETLSAVAERAEGRKLSLAEVSSYWYGRGLRFWGEHPGQALVLSGKKALLGLNSEEAPIHHAYVFGAVLAPVLRVLPGFGVIFPFALLGALWGVRREALVRLLTLCAAAYWLSLVVFYVADRYRILLLPMLLPLFGLGVMGLYQRAREAGFSRLWGPLALLLCAFGLTQLPLGSATQEGRALATGFNLMGKAAGDRGDLNAAEAYFRQAIEVSGPRHGKMARHNLGLVLEKKGDLAGARELYLGILEIDPGNIGALMRLARLAEAAGDLAGAARWREEMDRIRASKTTAEDLRP